MADDQHDPPRNQPPGEPGADDETQRIPADQPSSARPPPPAGQPAAEPPGKPRRRWGGRSVGLPVAAAVAAGLMVVSGLAGYALGVATSGIDELGRVSFQRDGFPPGPDGHCWGRGGRDGFPVPPPGMDGQTPPDLGDPGDGTDGGSGGSEGGGDGSTEDSGSTT